MVAKEKGNYKIKIENKITILKRKQFYYFVSDNFSLYNYPLINYGAISGDYIKEVVNYYEDKLIDQSLTHPIFDDSINLFKKYIHRLKKHVILQV